MSSGNGAYEETRFIDVVGYFHGSAAGDFDNDGVQGQGSLGGYERIVNKG